MFLEISGCLSKDANDFFGKNAVFSPSRHTSVLVYGVLRVLTATKADHSASERRPWRSYCVLIAIIVVLRTQ